MRDVAQYRQKAAEFDALARTSPDEKLRSSYRELAREYRDLAAALERIASKFPRQSDKDDPDGGNVV